MSWLHIAYLLVFALDLVTACVIIFVERHNAAVTWAWLMVLLFIPVGGFVLYVLFGQHISRYRLARFRLRNAPWVARAAERQHRQVESGRAAYSELAAHRHVDLIALNLKTAYAVYTEDNRVDVFVRGVDKFEAMFQDIRQAKDHIHLEYYIFRPDDLGERLVRLLAEKAREGVEVRLLYDAVGCAWTPKSFFDPLVREGGQVAAFFPSRIPYVNLRMNNRNHRKIVVVDGRVAYVGGFNVGDEYLGKDERFGFWRDTHLRIEGSAILELQSIFLLDWNSSSRCPVEFDDRYFPRVQGRPGTTGMQVVASGPDTDWEQIRNAYIKMIYAAKESIYIQTPYFVPDDSLLTALKIASLSGVDVKVMLPGKPDHLWVFWASRFYLGDLLQAGVECYLYRDGFLHAKMVVADRELASVGTANIDIRSFKLNFEVNALMFDRDKSGHLADLFERDLEKCDRLTLEQYRSRPRAERIMESCARLLSPIL
ncbi:cardiolipin synthase [Alicyclobacillus mali]|uniref:Cardiolipin synthase n=1 Tax=Alicyclobacillus mali (ex Roth et al. 2021) TaxID=1123961 RepID=A0ABS0F676_9BACL|nr:cardiolipin synthase [Alicyclobacillus mali (ex Roth et al. 2021)]MBF8378806.1 cardiolipin synthase [Alicyclobacillus mali (ex Roth et al. 2021)]MCL6487787.1 cardiolipin synthase [Alicyclobacillus mali (ex Roth et al. 2021)]